MEQEVTEYPLTEGVYDIPIEHYHEREICPTPSISSSGLSRILSSPARFWWQSTMNPKRDPVDTVALKQGRAAHCLFMDGQDAFTARFAILPEGLTLAKKEGKEFAEQAQTDGKTLLRWADWQTVKSLTDALAAHPLARAAYTDGKAEQTMIWKDEETGVYLRARPDWLPNEVARMFDYKTTRNAHKLAFSRSIYDYGYHQSAAHIMAGCRALGLGNPEHFYFIAQEKEPPYLIALYALNRDALEWGDVQNRAAIRLFAQCLERDHWPGYSESVEEIGLPSFATFQLQNQDFNSIGKDAADEHSRNATDYIAA